MMQRECIELLGSEFAEGEVAFPMMEAKIAHADLIKASHRRWRPKASDASPARDESLFCRYMFVTCAVRCSVSP